jgi:hypothetical protein
MVRAHASTQFPGGAMIFGMTYFAFFHVLLSLIGILTGFIVMFGLFSGSRMDGMTAIFLLTTILTSVTGFLFPYHGPTPGIIIGIISLMLLAVSVYARYVRKMVGGMRKAYVITAMLALWLNVFILIAQLFEKVPALHALAASSKAPFLVSQVVVLILFILFTNRAVKAFRGEALRPA